MKDNYDDIINLPHHVSKVHKQMPIAKRAMYFSPFKSLGDLGDIGEGCGKQDNESK